MKIQTSYFARYKEDNGVSVARGTPKWFKGSRIIELCPSWELVKDKVLSEAEWTEIYTEKYLSVLDPFEMISQLDGKVMLCWEKPGEFCHRRIIAKWIEEKTGIVVPEVEFASKVIDKLNQKEKKKENPQLPLF